ncbi:MAG: tetratricopeptide repeat protein [Oceanicaulis sp.]
MTRSQIFDPTALLRSAAAAVVAAALGLTLIPSAEAQRNGGDNEEEEEQENRQLSSRVGEAVLAAQELMEADQNQQAIDALTPVLSTEITAYERSIILRLRGNAHFSLDNVEAAIRDFSAAVDTGALVRDEIIALRTNLAQLYMISEQYERGIEQFQLAIQAGAELTPRLSKLLAQAYIQASDGAGEAQQRQYLQDGLQYAERFYEGEPDKSEGDYNLLQFYYINLDRPQDELRVVRDALQAFPGSRRSWSNLVSLYARLDREEDAFEANKLMYLNGLFEEEDELFRLVQYYSFYNNPYRGATILEREMNAGRIPSNERYLESLANMWRQAAEFDRAIPVLERLSDLLGDGETALKLAEAHYQLNNLPEAENALELALDRGGLDNTGQAWELLGNVRFDQDKRQEALEAFSEAARFSGSRATANRWIGFVNSQIEGEERRRIQRIQVQIEECALNIDSERRSLVLIGEVNEDGSVTFPEGTIPDRCEPWFDMRTGEQIREADMTDEEFAQAQEDRARQLEQQGEG